MKTTITNKSLYWGTALLALIIIALALILRPSSARAESSTLVPDTTQSLPAAFKGKSVHPALAKKKAKPKMVISGMEDPRAEQNYHGANSPNGGISPHNMPTLPSPNPEAPQH